VLKTTEVIILGSINETQTTAYDLVKILQDTNINPFGRISKAYIYETIDQLRNQHLISDTAKKISYGRYTAEYAITEAGKKELRSSLVEYITEFHIDSSLFVIAAYFIDVFTIEEQKELLQQRLTTLNSQISGTQRLLPKIFPEDTKFQRIQLRINSEKSYAKRILRALESVDVCAANPNC
jgi:DNA-binding PadR family transcriptional regulator